MNGELIYIIQNILSLHSMQSYHLNREIKDNICKLLFSLMDSLSYSVLQEHISTDDLLYCDSQNSFEKLSKCKEDVYLCCSKTNSYNNHIPFIKPYKYHYCFRLKPNTYGIDLNSFFEGNCKLKRKILITISMEVIIILMKMKLL